MAAPTTKPSQPAPEQVLPLENGDQLTREEFERRYEAMPDLKKAELIEGVVYVPSPVRHNRHGRPHAALITWLGVYEVHTPGVQTSDNSTVRLDMKNEPQPDAVLLIDPECGGKAVISSDDYLESAPELAAEVASSSASIDVTKKLNMYLRNGVQEYIVWRVLDREVDWFVLRGNRYERLPQAEEGIFSSEVFPGLWLDPAALVRRELAKLHEVLHRGLASPEHATFVKRLKETGGVG